MPDLYHSLMLTCAACKSFRAIGQGQCGEDSRPVTDHAREAACPRGLYRMGAGDVVARLTSAVGIKSCGGCKDRQAALNKFIPFSRK